MHEIDYTFLFLSFCFVFVFLFLDSPKVIWRRGVGYIVTNLV